VIGDGLTLTELMALPAVTGRITAGKVPGIGRIRRGHGYERLPVQLLDHDLGSSVPQDP